MNNESSKDEWMKEIYKHFQSSQEKYVYFILAATITAIGFTITQTQTFKISYSIIPLALSILSWGFSFYFGCLNRYYYISTLYADYNLGQTQNEPKPTDELNS